MTAFSHGPGPALRLFGASDLAADRSAGGINGGSINDKGPELHGRRSLRWFLERWFEPRHWRDRPGRPKSVQVYHEAVAWWERCHRSLGLPEPAIGQIDAAALRRVRDWLPGQPYWRGPAPLGPASGHLSPWTASKLTRALRTLCARLGPTQEEDDERSGVLRLAPRVVAPTPPENEPDPPGLDQIRRWIQQAWSDRQRGLAAAIGFAFYTGWRQRAMLSIEWSAVEPTPDGLWKMTTRGLARTQTKNVETILLHPRLRDLLAACGSTPAIGGRIVPWPFQARWLVTHWHRLQARTDPQARRRAWHSLKSAAVEAAGNAGGEAALAAAQLLGGHSSARTTLRHYSAQLRRALLLPDVLPPEI